MREHLEGCDASRRRFEGLQAVVVRARGVAIVADQPLELVRQPMRSMVLNGGAAEHAVAPARIWTRNVDPALAVWSPPERAARKAREGIRCSRRCASNTPMPRERRRDLWEA